VLSETQYCVLAAKPYTLDIDGLREIPDLLWRIDGIIIVGVHYTGIVEENIETAPRIDMLNHSLHVGFLGNIGDFGLNPLRLWNHLF
jgi:hypothetical protein